MRSNPHQEKLDPISALESIRAPNWGACGSIWDKKSATQDGRAIPLTKTDYALLTLLARNTSLVS